MPIRLSGLSSGLDTEAIVSALVTSYSEKKKKYQKSQQKLSWTQDAWKSVNTAVHDLYTKASSLRFSSAYTSKKSVVSDPAKATVKAGSGAPNGTQSLKITQLAQSGYLTGGKLATNNSTSLSGSTKLSELAKQNNADDSVFGSGDTGSISVKTGNGSTKKIDLSGDMTINQFVNKLKDAGLQANFDSSNGRIYVNSKDSGANNDFSIVASDEKGLSALSKLGLVAAEDADSASNKAYSALAAHSEKSAEDIKGILETMQGAMRSRTAATQAKADSQAQLDFANAYKAYADVRTEARNAGEETLGKLDELEAKLASTNEDDISRVNELAKELGLITEAENEDGTTTTDDSKFTEFKKNRDAVVPKLTADPKEAYVDAIVNAYENGNIDTEIGDINDRIAAAEEQYNNAETVINNKDNSAIVSFAGGISESTEPDEIASKAAALKSQIAFAADYTDTVSKYTSSTANRQSGKDAQIVLNGVDYTSTSNNFSINGLSITANGVTGTKDDPGITISTSTDVQGLYDKIKDFLSQYNEVINDIYGQYNAASSRGYNPLTEEEKEAMSDKQVEKWEEKIKASLLRRDTTLGGIISTMTNAMASSYEVNGEKYSLSSFGIKTLGYFASSKNENYSYHIDGDEDDSAVSGNSDKLMAALSKDPDSVVEFMKQLTDGLYKGLDKKMKSTTLRSAYTIYNDKEMASEYSDYTNLISKWDKRIKAMEDSYFKKFAKMESALSTLQQSTSSLASMLGG